MKLLEYAQQQLERRLLEDPLVMGVTSEVRPASKGAGPQARLVEIALRRPKKLPKTYYGIPVRLRLSGPTSLLQE